MAPVEEVERQQVGVGRGAHVGDLAQAVPQLVPGQPLVDQDGDRAGDAAPWLRIPDGALDTGRTNGKALRGSVFGAFNLHTTATAMARFFAELTAEEGPVGRLLGPGPHAELLASQVTGFDEVFGTRLTWTLGLIRDRGKIAKGGIGGSAAWWSLRHGHGCAYLTRRLDDHARAAEVAAALGDDLAVVGED